MGLKTRVRWRWIGCGGCVAVVCCGVLLQVAVVRAASKPDTKTGARASGRRVEMSAWELAERGRETLEAIPEAERTKADYALALDGFRAVYHETPQDVHAASAVNAVAELLAEQGRGLHDAKSLKAAVGQYEFLRTQYPGSSLRVGALLAEAQIEANDLGDVVAAREKYSLLVKQYPGSGKVEEAKAGLAALEQGGREKGTGNREQGTGIREQGLGSKEQGLGSKGQRALVAGGEVGSAAGGGVGLGTGGAGTGAVGTGASGTTAPGTGLVGASRFGAMPVTRSAEAVGVVSAARSAGTGGAGTGGVKGGAATGVAESGAGVTAVERRGTSAPVDAALDAMGRADDSGRLDEAGTGAGAGVSAAGALPARTGVGVSSAAARTVRRRGGLAQVTGIRHWSTPTYTRVAIDLGDDVTYEAARVPNPDRIYFDLHGTQLARELVGKSFAVTDDGFLKKIRAAQFSNDMTRVVLDVNDVTEYSAFLLPNPYRLIIDIHGGAKEQGAGNREQGTGNREQGAAKGDAELVAGGEVPVPRAAVTVKPTAGRPVPNTVTTKSVSTTEIAGLSAQPGKVEATSMPTSSPISAVVQGSGSREGTGSREQGTGKSGLPAVGGSVAALPAAGGTGRKSRKGKAGKAAEDSSAVPARAAVPTADGQTSLVRALGLKIGRIVIDAGHGGHDSGTLGVDGIEEKDVVLDVALRLGKILHDRLGAEVVYTRSDDTFIPLETRTAIANKAQADLFLSIHANSSNDATARGVETYYLNFTSQTDSLEVAARENAVSDQSIHQLSDLVKKIALKDKISESREFAGDVEQSLYGGLQRGNSGLKDRGVKKAPFVVLIGANMPSILAEISFVTNPKDANQLRQPEYRERVAESLYKGVAKYAGGLSGVKEPTERASVR